VENNFHEILARAVQYLFQSGSSFWLQICSVKTSFLSPEIQSRKPIDPGSSIFMVKATVALLF
jgi:hypothetical protein